MDTYYFLNKDKFTFNNNGDDKVVYWGLFLQIFVHVEKETKSFCLWLKVE